LPCIVLGMLRCIHLCVHLLLPLALVAGAQNVVSLLTLADLDRSTTQPLKGIRNRESNYLIRCRWSAHVGSAHQHWLHSLWQALPMYLQTCLSSPRLPTATAAVRMCSPPTRCGTRQGHCRAGSSICSTDITQSWHQPLTVMHASCLNHASSKRSPRTHRHGFDGIQHCLRLPAVHLTHSDRWPEVPILLVPLGQDFCLHVFIGFVLPPQVVVLVLLPSQVSVRHSRHMQTEQHNQGGGCGYGWPSMWTFTSSTCVRIRDLSQAWDRHHHQCMPHNSLNAHERLAATYTVT
jgi:hypothetical protein